MIVSNPSSSTYIRAKDGTLLQPSFIDVSDISSANILNKTLVFMRSTDNKYCLPTVIQDRSNKIIEKVSVNIGNWDMDTQDSVSIEHGLGVTKEKILGVDILIIADSGVFRYILYAFYDISDPGLLSAGIVNYTDTHIILSRRTGGLFDHTNYSTSPFNRGEMIFSIDIS